VGFGRAIVAIRKRACTIRAAGIIVAALVAAIAFTSREVHAQVRPPSVTSISPNNGPAAGGTPIIIAGNNFTGANAVRFGGTPATSFTVNSATSITATSPAGSGTVDVTVTNSGGTSATSSADQFAYVAPPVASPSVTSISPQSGPATGGMPVTISGNNFTGANAVRFGGTPATSFTVNSATSITAISPAGSGTVDVTVTNSGATSATGPADQFSYFVSPSVTSISPNSGPVAGGTPVTISGNNFTGANAVRFGGTPATSFTVNSATSITATSPAGSGTMDVTVTNLSGTSATSSASQFTYGLAATTTSLSSSRNPSSLGQSATFTARVPGVSPTGTVIFFDGAMQIGTGALVAGVANFTTSSLTAGSHSITARYGGDPSNLASASAALTQTVSIPTDSIKLRQMQVSVTPMIAQISGQAIVGAIDSAIDAGFNSNPQAITPSGSGFTYQIPLGEPLDDIIDRRTGGRSGNSAGGSVAIRTGGGSAGADAGSLANGRQGGNGAPPGTRLIDLPVIPPPPGSGMPALDETGFSPDELMLQVGSAVTPQYVARMAQRFGLTMLTQQTIRMLGRTVYTFRIANGRSVRETIHQIEASGFNGTVQPNYTFTLTQDQTKSEPILGDPAQYTLKKLHLAEAHKISKGENAVIAVIDSEIDPGHPDLVGRITDRFDAGCGASSPDAHGTGMAGAIVSHVRLLGVAPYANIIAICAFGGVGQPKASSIKIIKGLDYAIQRGARIVNMSFAGPLDPALSQALQIAREKGILIVAAAGNNGPKSPPLYPGADRSVLAVTATDENDRLFYGASQGKYVTIAAPGVDILVPAPGGGLQFTTGTSVATAAVSGVAALLLAHKPSLKPEEIRAILVRTAKRLGSGDSNPQFGAGLVDPLKALELLLSEKPPSEHESAKRMFASFDASSKCVDDDFSALGYAARDKAVAKASPFAGRPPNWLAWIDVRGTDFSRTMFGSDLKGVQVNAIAGLTHKFTPDFLVGMIVGYEHFDYSSQAFNGVLKGEGWTTGAYLGWRFAPNLRFDAAIARSDILVNDVAGTAAGNFTGHRWLTSGGVTGTYNWQQFVLEPSARVYALWERENAYTDTLGTLQTARDFSTGRASGGIKLSYAVARSATSILSPYVGIYGDYYFNGDSAGAPAPGAIPSIVLDGWSARAVGGLMAKFDNGAQLAIGGERSGIGGGFRLWTYRARASLPFGVQ
jgi:hypothetical protein